MKRCLVLALGLLGILIETAQAEPDSYAGLCDASAAISLGGGSFVVAEDENLNKLFVYQADEQQPQSTLDLLDYLGNANGDDPLEADLEGAARIGDDIYWISSLGRNDDGEVEESRFRFFATPLANEGGALTVKMPMMPPVKTLRDALIADPGLAALGLGGAASKPPKQGGLSIEGLAATSDGALLIGLRSPLQDKKAIVIPLLNPAAVIGGASPDFGDFILIDLAERGIRSIEKVGEGYLILGGDPGEGDAETRLYGWTGVAGASAVDLNADLGGLNGEALFAADQNDLYVLSDDGERKIDGRKCKKLEVEKKVFRGIRVAL